MSFFFVIAVIILVFLIIFQIAKASEYVAVLKGEERAKRENNKINGFFMIGFLIAVVIGLRNWFSFTGDAPSNAMQIEVTGKQFGWIFRYPGNDEVFGKRYFKMIDPASNSLGLNWHDSTDLNIKDDPNTHDDIVTEQ